MRFASIILTLGLFTSAQATTLGNILKHSGIVIQECAIPRTAALTFDDGPNDYQIASHTWTHPDLTTLTDAQINEEMKKTDEAIEAILGVRVAYMRPPYGAVNANVTAVAKARGQDVVIWNLDSQDWNVTPAESEAIYNTTVATNPSTVLALNHETYNTTATEVLPYAIKLLQSRGYKLVTVAECMGSYPYQWAHLPARNLSSYKCT
ncbi:carbohydrate esterase family 4 protein [Serendipita vermifera MAFF 305830]|uniref:Carbohydrate esterase family 4 protein n=1 Tax=Serendipita vermifera MAFF 305830 TaxID=933852 RepID=A0A0C2W467_SERVB|nr:carbohydrate esterase family 4 protein [Serendipita vermifera MAFF 305830]